MPNHRKRRTHAGYKARLLAYKIEGRQVKNKALKLKRHLASHPNDEQSKERLTPKSYKRVKPYSYWELFNLTEQERRKANGNGSNNVRPRMPR